MIEGTCLCGALRYEIDGPLTSMMNCHCSMCRKQHGTAFATYVVAPASGFRWIAGEDEVARYRSSPQGTRSFCRRCGSVAPTALPAMGVVFAPAGNLRGELGLRPEGHMFVGSKAPWHTIADHLPQHEVYPPGFPAEGVPRPRVAPREGVTEGSCLCGEVAYELRGAPVRMMNCHCTRCRQGRSAAHATNVFYAADALRFTRGAELVREYKVPEAKFHAVAFCSRCGGKVPRVSPERGIAIVPAGSLDTDPGMRPMAHIFVADKAPWYDIADALPQFAQMPPAPG
jgi:hypothetical protein